MASTNELYSNPSEAFSLSRQRNSPMLSTSAVGNALKRNSLY